MAGHIWLAEQALMCHPVLYSDWGYFNSPVYEACRGQCPSFCMTTHCIRISSMGLSQWVAVLLEAHAQNLRNYGVLLSNYRLSFMSQLKRLYRTLPYLI